MRKAIKAKQVKKSMLIGEEEKTEKKYTKYTMFGIDGCEYIGARVVDSAKLACMKSAICGGYYAKVINGLYYIPFYRSDDSSKSYCEVYARK